MHDMEYARKVHEWSASEQWHAEAEELLSRCRLKTLDTVLDVGTNMGRMLGLIQDKGGIPVGVETNGAAAYIARQSGFRVFPAIGDAARIRGPFDIVLLSHVLGHVPDPEEMLNWCLAATNRKGRIGVVVPNPTFDRLMRPMNVITGYRNDRTFKHLIGLRQLREMLPWWFEITDVFYLGEKPKWLPARAVPDSTRSRLGVIIRRK